MRILQLILTLFLILTTPVALASCSPEEDFDLSGTELTPDNSDQEDNENAEDNESGNNESGDNEENVSGNEDNETEEEDTGGADTEDGEDNSNGDETDTDMKTDSITLKIGNSSFLVVLEDNATARAFAALLPLTMTMNELNGNEKYYMLPDNLPTASSRPGRIENGDLMLYGSNCIVLFYDTFTTSYSYTRIGKVVEPNGLAAAVEKGRISVTIETP